MSTKPAGAEDGAGTPAASGWRKVPMLIVGLTALLVVMLTAFALPSINSGPHKVPVAVAGPGPAADQIAGKLAAARPGAFSVRKVADAEEARDRIDDRDVYGAVVLGTKPGARPEVLIATAASPSIAASLRALAQSLDPAAADSAVAVHDLHPPTDDDPNGVGLSSGALPLVLGGYLAAAAIVILLREPAQRAATALGFALLGGFALGALLQYGFGITDGNYGLISLAIAFGTAATCLTIMGLHSVLGGAGLGLGAAMMILLGNPLSGLAAGPEWLPSGWGAFGQFLPPGAGGTLLRSTAFFDGSGSFRALLVLAGWLIGGLALFLIGARRAEAKTPSAPAAEETGKEQEATLTAP
ncbi:hypothetical protein I5Q34_14345 [Streptomyces sp. AV19]|uniref:hypothetical protein n=1 Tax=Streptomyces sp. AV19 TaxID=2793068 RepID=UPI0018FE9248|nr:hypothetical protein [Streptomyces sp. AV19]MBH1935438.1 hypothetical protein [Streptomyces sp. AV19]MDG4531324.1 ABC transporter permease [Streptomyces sp. AV19]